MNLYISDTHFGHRNVINFDKRPFEDIEQMDQVLSALWNDRVQKDDDVWILGDFCYRSHRAPEWYLRQLKGLYYAITPIAEWPHIHRGAYHLFGHIHNRMDDTYYFMKERQRAYNAGCMINNYAPASLREIIMNNMRFYETDAGRE